MAAYTREVCLLLCFGVQCEDFVGVGGEVSDLLATQQKEYESGNTFEFSPQVPAFLSKVAASLSHAYDDAGQCRRYD